MIPYARPHTILPALAARIGPPIRRPVSESARRVVKVRRGSGTVDSWSAETTPYMVEPMDQLESRRMGAAARPARLGAAPFALMTTETQDETSLRCRTI